MAGALVLAGLMFAQAAQPGITVESSPDRFDVGYRELVAQRPADAIERIAANRSLEADDPAALINLGTADARLGNLAGALDHDRSAIARRQRYDLELGDGRWTDSGAAARLAIALLTKGKAVAH